MERRRSARYDGHCEWKSCRRVGRSISGSGCGRRERGARDQRKEIPTLARFTKRCTRTGLGKIGKTKLENKEGDKPLSPAGTEESGYSGTSARDGALATSQGSPSRA